MKKPKRNCGAGDADRNSYSSPTNNSLLLTLIVTLTTSYVSAQTGVNADVTLSQKWGRAAFSSCDLSARVYGDAAGRLSLRCTPNINPPVRDVAETRDLSKNESETLVRLIHASKLYDGGHTGTGTMMSEGPWETLTAQCCDRRDIVVLVTLGNDTFQAGTDRHRLLQQLYEWQAELTNSLFKKKWR